MPRALRGVLRISKLIPVSVNLLHHIKAKLAIASSSITLAANKKLVFDSLSSGNNINKSIRNVTNHSPVAKSEDASISLTRNNLVSNE